MTTDYVSLNGFKMFENPGDFIEGILLGYTAGVIGQFSMVTTEGMVSFNETAQMHILKNLPAGVVVRVMYDGPGPKSVQGQKIKLFSIQMDRASFDVYRANLMLGMKPTLPQIEADPFAADEVPDEVIPHPAG